MKKYKVLTQKDKWFSGKFDPEKKPTCFHKGVFMNKSKSLILGMTTMILIFLLTACGQKYDDENDFRVSIIDSYVMITSYVGGKQFVNIPPTINKLNVFGIGGGAFSEQDVVRVTIPSGVQGIGVAAFEDCVNLASITIPSSVILIGSSAFASCELLTSVTIPSNLRTISEGIFAYCTGLKSVTIPSSVTSIGNGAFYKCTSLTSITIPSNVTSVGYDAFGYWTGNQTINIQGHANQASADRAWGPDWRADCNARINYRG